MTSITREIKDVSELGKAITKEIFDKGWAIVAVDKDNELRRVDNQLIEQIVSRHVMKFIGVKLI